LDFKVAKQKNNNAKKYQKDELDYALQFAKLAHTEFEEFLKGVILFGSAARKIEGKQTTAAKNIDILILLDDVTFTLSKEMIEAYKIISQKLVLKVSKRIHVTTLKMSTFWDYIRLSDPVGVNILRDGVALLDTGFFSPMQALLQKGHIQPTFESIWTHFNRAPETLNKSRSLLIKATLDLYWACIDSAHAVLMKEGNIPASPEHVADLMEQKLVKNKICQQRYATIMRNMYKLQKEITHRQIEDISGTEYEKYYSQAKQFVEKMRMILNKE
jgi:uncharacterized protein (UPF0332 family)/predicted nucleotidyltransferase